MFKKRFWIILFLLLISPLKSFAYDNFTTHPALTSEIVKFYNNFYTPKINEEEKNWLISGSTKEDEPLSRTLNHFFDPIYNRGLSGEINAGSLTAFLKILKPFIQNAKEWAQNSYRQAMFLGEAYKNAVLNPYAQLTKSALEILSVHTWEKAIYNYILGNKKQAFEDLGHVLHLLEDMGVPAHTRNDHHLTGDDYEKYASQFTPENINIISQLKERKPLIFDNLNDYFNDLAFYTNTHFYSQDTIGVQSGYNQPEWNYLETKIINNKIYAFNNDEFGYYYLLRKDTASGIIILIQPSLILDDLILQSYWSHLSKKIILSGSGVLKLFFEEVEKYRNDQDFLKKMQKTLFAIMIDNLKKNLGLVAENEEIYKQNEQEIKESLINPNLSSTTQEASHTIIFSLPTPQPTEQFHEVEIFQNQNTPSPIIIPTPSFSPSPTFSPSIAPPPTPILPSQTISFVSSANPTSSPIPETPSPSPFLSPSPSLSPSPTPTPILTPSPLSKILISEILYDAGHGDEGKEFIELYNPNDFAIDLSGWSLRIAKNNSTTTSSLAVIRSTDSKNIIPAKGFFLFGFYNYSAANYNNVEADVVRSANLPDGLDGNCYTIYLINKNGEIIDAITYDKNIGLPGKSLERKAKESSTVESMTVGEDRFLGNSYDSDSASDFIVRNPQPQNSLSLPEPRDNPFIPININYYFTEENVLNLNFSLTNLSSQERKLKVEILTSLSKNDFINNQISSLNISEVLLESYDWLNNQFSGKVNNLKPPFYLVLRTIDEEGLASPISEILLVSLPIQQIENEPVVFYNSADNSGYYASLSNWYGPTSFSFVFSSENDGYLKQISALVRADNCALTIGLDIYSVDEDNSLGEFLGSSFSFVAIDKFYEPFYFDWLFEDGKIILSQNKKYAAVFKITSSLPGNCWANFYGTPKLSMKIQGRHSYLTNLSQRINNVLIVEGETIFANNIVISANPFSYNNFPLKIQVELKPRNFEFDNNIKPGDPFLFESNFVSSGEEAEVFISNLSDNAYHWRVRAIDIFGYTSDWFYYGDPNNSDFYIDAIQNDYQENTLYSLDPQNKSNEYLTEWASTMYGPSIIFSTFLTHEGGYVDRIELPAYYFYCSFPVRAYIYSISPNQVNGYLDQLLATSIEGANSGTFNGDFGLLVWRFDKPVFLEKNRYYALKLDFSEVNTGTANCSINYQAHPDIMSSNVYLLTNEGWQVKSNNDLNFIVYKALEERGQNLPINRVESEQNR